MASCSAPIAPIASWTKVIGGCSYNCHCPTNPPWVPSRIWITNTDGFYFSGSLLIRNCCQSSAGRFNVWSKHQFEQVSTDMFFLYNIWLLFFGSLQNSHCWTGSWEAVQTTMFQTKRRNTLWRTCLTDSTCLDISKPEFPKRLAATWGLQTRKTSLLLQERPPRLRVSHDLYQSVDHDHHFREMPLLILIIRCYRGSSDPGPLSREHDTWVDRTRPVHRSYPTQYPDSSGPPVRCETSPGAEVSQELTGQHRAGRKEDERDGAAVEEGRGLNTPKWRTHELFLWFESGFLGMLSWPFWIAVLVLSSFSPGSPASGCRARFPGLFRPFSEENPGSEGSGPDSWSVEG